MQGAQRVVPVGLQCVGDETVLGVDREVAAAGELGALVGALDVAFAQLVGLIGACFQLALDYERDLERERGDGVKQQLADGVIDALARDDQALPDTGLDRLAGALVVGDQGAATLVILHGHPLPATSADGESLQQGGALAGGPGGAVSAVRSSVGGEQPLVDLELLPGEIAVVRFGD